MDAKGTKTVTSEATLTDFLLARIAEDEAVARGVMDVDPNWLQLDEHEPWHCDEQTDHVALAPARLLAECEAKRRIVAEHRPGPAGTDGIWCVTCLAAGTFPCPTMRLLAHPYADHPGFREEWRA